jgi:HSP20 family molecular chaperone IbpA
MAEKTVPATTDAGSVKTQEELRAPDRYMTPPVDIFETPEGLVVVADLPGVRQSGLDVRVEDDTLTIHGRPDVSTQGTELYREYALGDFFRQFELTETVDQDGIRANLQHGVLTLSLPKVAKARPRRIAVQVN